MSLTEEQAAPGSNADLPPERPSEAASGLEESAKKPVKKRRRWRRVFGFTFLIVAAVLVAGRLSMPWAVRSYVNRTIDRNPLYDGKIGDVEIHLWRGAYTIRDIRLIKTTGNVPVPLFVSRRMDLAIQWDALWDGKVVGRVAIDDPEINFVDSADESQTQTGAGGPWLEIIRDLFPFKINAAQVRNGSIHFRAFHSDPPVDLYISHLDATLENLTNVRDQVTPLIATVKAKGLAMGHAPVEYQMKLDPFSYRPTFQMAVRLIGLDVTKINSLTRAYGMFDFERGFFDLVVEVDAKEGQLEGYVKPLFRDIKVFSLRKDIPEDNVLEVFWEALVGFTTELLKNPPRDQFGTMIPLRGDVTGPQTNVLNVVANVLRNAFIRAYLPRLENTEATRIEGLEFGRGSIVEPSSVGK